MRALLNRKVSLWSPLRGRSDDPKSVNLRPQPVLMALRPQLGALLSLLVAGAEPDISMAQILPLLVQAGPPGPVVHALIQPQDLHVVQ